MNKFFNIFSCVVLLSLTQSCFMQQEDLFEDSAMERLEAKKVEILDVLTSAKNGWTMEYFGSDESTLPGYFLLVKFEKSGDNGTVQFAAKNAITNNQYVITDGSDPNYPSSLFDIVFDNGPVLTFNSYNNLFHKFSDPNATGLPGDQGLGTGLGGDYEFIVISMEPADNPTKVLLKGKKRGTYTVLNKLADDVVWKDYIAQLDELNNNMYYNNPAPLRMVLDNSSAKTALNLYNGSTGIFSAVDSETDDLTYAETKKFIQTNAGLRFDVPFEYNDGTWGQDFYFNEDKSRLEAYVDGDPSKGVLAHIESVSPYWFYVKSLNPDANNIYTAEWQIVEDNMGSKFKEKYDALKSAFEADGRTNLKLYIGGLSSVGDALQFQAKNITRSNYWVQLAREESAEGETVKYAKGESVSKYYENLCKVYPQVADLTACFNANFRFELTQPFCLATVRVVSVDDPEMSFVVSYIAK